MTHDDLVAVLLLLGVGAVDVAAEGSLDASPVFVILLEYGTEVEIRPDCVIRPIRSQCPMQGTGEQFHVKMSPTLGHHFGNSSSESPLWQCGDALARYGSRKLRHALRRTPGHERRTVA